MYQKDSSENTGTGQHPNRSQSEKYPRNKTSGTPDGSLSSQFPYYFVGGIIGAILPAISLVANFTTPEVGYGVSYSFILFSVVSVVVGAWIGHLYYYFKYHRGKKGDTQHKALEGKSSSGVLAQKPWPWYATGALIGAAATLAISSALLIGGAKWLFGVNGGSSEGVGMFAVFLVPHLLLTISALFPAISLWVGHVLYRSANEEARSTHPHWFVDSILYLTSSLAVATIVLTIFMMLFSLTLAFSVFPLVLTGVIITAVAGAVSFLDSKKVIPRLKFLTPMRGKVAFLLFAIPAIIALYIFAMAHLFILNPFG